MSPYKLIIAYIYFNIILGHYLFIGLFVCLFVCLFVFDLLQFST